MRPKFVNKPIEPNAKIAPQLAIGNHWLGVGDLKYSAINSFCMKRTIAILILCTLGGHSSSLTPVEEAQQIRTQNDFKKIEQQLVAILAFPKNASKEPANTNIRSVVLRDDDGSLKSLIGNVTIDPWGSPYRLIQKGKDIMILSAGPDKKFDSSDDLSYKVTLKAEPSAPGQSPPAASLK